MLLIEDPMATSEPQKVVFHNQATILALAYLHCKSVLTLAFLQLKAWSCLPCASTQTFLNSNKIQLKLKLTIHYLPGDVSNKVATQLYSEVLHNLAVLSSLHDAINKFSGS